MKFNNPYKISRTFKPQVLAKPTGGFIVTSQVNSVGIFAQEFDFNGMPLGSNQLIQYAFAGDPIDGHFAAYANNLLHLFHTPSNPRRLIYQTTETPPIDFGKEYFGDTFACFNDNACFADGNRLYLAVKRYGSPDQIVLFEKQSNKFSKFGQYQGTKTPRICAKDSLVASFARSNQAEPAQSQFNWIVVNNGTTYTGNIDLYGQEINGGMECATNGESVMFGFGRDEIRLYKWQSGQMHLNTAIPAGDVAGDGFDICALPDKSYIVMWQDKITAKAYYALEKDNYKKQLLWDLGGDPSTTLEAEALVADTRLVFSAVGGADRSLYVTSSEIKNKEYNIMYTNCTITLVEALRLLDTRGGSMIGAVPIVVDTNRPTAKAVMVTITAVGATAGGHFRAFPENLSDTATSLLNYSTAPKAIANTTIIPLYNGKFKLVSGGAPSHAIVDIVAFVE
jgi:hypothetical protein